MNGLFRRRLWLLERAAPEGAEHLFVSLGENGAPLQHALLDLFQFLPLFDGDIDPLPGVAYRASGLDNPLELVHSSHSVGTQVLYSYRRTG
jgi:hypothetical protein